MSGVGAETGDRRAAGGVQVTLPTGWSKVARARETRVDDPRTLLVVGTDGVKAVESDCRWPRTASLRRRRSRRDRLARLGRWLEPPPLSAMKLRRGTFECFAGRGAVGRLTLRDRDSR